MALPDDGRLSALAFDRRPGRDVRGHGDGNESASAPIRIIRQDNGSLGHQALVGTGRRRATQDPCVDPTSGAMRMELGGATSGSCDLVPLNSTSRHTALGAPTMKHAQSCASTACAERSRTRSPAACEAGLLERLHCDSEKRNGTHRNLQQRETCSLTIGSSRTIPPGVMAGAPRHPGPGRTSARPSGLGLASARRSAGSTRRLASAGAGLRAPGGFRARCAPSRHAGRRPVDL
jgi:hypothetical protein